MIKIRLNESRKILKELFIKNETGTENPTYFFFKVNNNKQITLFPNEADKKSEYQYYDRFCDGYIDLDTKSMIVFSTGSDTLSGFSIQAEIFKKIARQFGIKKVSQRQKAGEEQSRTKKEPVVRKLEPSGKLPKIGFRGMSIQNLLKVYSKGILPRSISKAYSNFGSDAAHTNTIFFTSDFEKARLYSRSSEKCVVEFKIPDESKIISDYDTPGAKEKNYERYNTDGQSDYNSEIRGKISNNDKQEMSYSKERGLFGYLGRIPPNHIMYVYIGDKKYPFAKYCESLKNQSNNNSIEGTERGRIR